MIGSRAIVVTEYEEFTIDEIKIKRLMRVVIVVCVCGLID